MTKDQAVAHFGTQMKLAEALGMSQEEWDECAEAEQEELKGYRLWIDDNLTEYETMMASNTNTPKSKSAKDKRMKRLAKKNPGGFVMSD